MQTKFLCGQALSWRTARGVPGSSWQVSTQLLLHGKVREQGAKPVCSGIKKTQSVRLCFIIIIPCALAEPYGSSSFHRSSQGTDDANLLLVN